MDTQRAVVLVAIVIGAVVSVALGSETIAATLAGGAIGALMPGPIMPARTGSTIPPPPPLPPPILPPRRRTGRTPVRGVPIDDSKGPGPT